MLPSLSLWHTILEVKYCPWLSPCSCTASARAGIRSAVSRSAFSAELFWYSLVIALSATLQAVADGGKPILVLCPGMNQYMCHEPHPDLSAQIHLFPPATMFCIIQRTLPQNYESFFLGSCCNRWS